jgi:transcriptional regulator with XRE-family HTH domain
MPEVGKTLSQARVARGLSLEDCERDTRISKRYLDALEREDWRIFPAPVYSRAFLRTYAQYLGLDAAQLMRSLREQEEPEIKPLPEIPSPSPTGSINWPLAVGVIVVLLIAGGLLYVSGRDGGTDAGDESATGSVTPVGEALGGGDQPALGRPVGPVEKGVVPDLAGVRLDDAVAALSQAEIDYIVVETSVVDGTPGVITSQSPPPGTEADGDTAVTLVMPRGG